MSLKLIEGDDKKREKKCRQRNEQILEKFDCYLIPEILFSGTTVTARAQIISKTGDKIQREACLKAITENLDQFDCTIIPEFVISGGDFRSRILTQTKPRTKKEERKDRTCSLRPSASSLARTKK